VSRQRLLAHDYTRMIGLAVPERGDRPARHHARKKPSRSGQGIDRSVVATSCPRGHRNWKPAPSGVGPSRSSSCTLGRHSSQPNTASSARNAISRAGPDSIESLARDHSGYRRSTMARGSHRANDRLRGSWERALSSSRLRRASSPPRPIFTFQALHHPFAPQDLPSKPSRSAPSRSANSAKPSQE